MAKDKIFEKALEKTKADLNIKDLKEVQEAVKDIPATNGVLTPIAPEEKELTPYPKVEYKIIEATTMDKVIRDVNTHLNNGWQTEGGIQVANGPVTRFYQSLIRWNVDAEEDLPTGIEEDVDG